MRYQKKSKSAKERWKKWHKFNTYRLHENSLILCPICSSNSITKKGFRNTTYCTAQDFFCNSCNKKFSKYPTEFSKYAHFPEEVKEYALSFDISSRKVSKKIEEKMGLRISYETILNWRKKEVRK